MEQRPALSERLMRRDDNRQNPDQLVVSIDEAAEPVLVRLEAMP